MASLSQISVILPSLNPDEKLLSTIDRLLEVGFTDIILVNDGSKQKNLRYFETADQYPQVHLLHHPENLGKGAALKTGFTWFLNNRAGSKGVITVDGDGQHHSEDVKACAEAMLDSQHLILGVRDFKRKDIPWRSRFGNRCTSGVFKFFVGMSVSDTQTGLRAIPAEYLEGLCEVDGDRFEYETNMLLAMKANHIPFQEVKIRTVYLEENKSSHFRPVRDSWRIYKLIFGHFFRYGISALVSAALDEGIFLLLSHWLSGVLSGFALTAVPVACARLLSSVFNFIVNKKLVFKSKGAVLKALLRYYMLAIPNAILQMLLTHGSYLVIGVTPEQTGLRAIIYAVVMAVLFVVSFIVQKRWVFVGKQQKNQE